MDTESANAQDARVDALWATLDTRKKGHLDLGGLKKGLRKLDHRTLAHRRESGTSLRDIIALKNADYLLSDVMKAVDTDGDGRIQYHG
jgi:solute carrier family 25 phosphate transporter 23/24/25/41